MNVTPITSVAPATAPAPTKRSAVFGTVAITSTIDPMGQGTAPAPTTSTYDIRRGADLVGTSNRNWTFEAAAAAARELAQQEHTMIAVFADRRDADRVDDLTVAPLYFSVHGAKVASPLARVNTANIPGSTPGTTWVRTDRISAMNLPSVTQDTGPKGQYSFVRTIFDEFGNELPSDGFGVS